MDSLVSAPKERSPSEDDDDAGSPEGQNIVALLGSNTERLILKPSVLDTSCGSPETLGSALAFSEDRGVANATADSSTKYTMHLSRLMSSAAEPGIDLSGRAEEAGSYLTRQRTASGRPHSAAVALRTHRNPGSLRYA
jgi:hypothetical protein